ncbi:MAG TPA: cysteine--tRNA ligase [Candidatus Cybelea sp.]|nr:cysteine--tRNA ligase [Candidatus Cybelea sp.]
MALRLYNTATRRKEDFSPIDPANVRMYVCGPTVYDYAHIGNSRPVIVFDVLFRLLRREYGAAHVTYVRNITDIDDRIIEAAKSSGEPIASITARTTKAFHEDMAALGNLPPSVEPRATETVAEMITMIEQLIAGGHAYAAEGHVLFHVPSMPDYGKLSRRNRDELIDGARVEVAPYKKDPADFVLWKPSAADQPGWDSPWGRGRPGWHIECSAMSKAHLGASFDIHGGGRDLIFPHHENELAQSECANHALFARFWVHNGFVTVNGEKMAKSLGNFITAHELLEKYPPEAIRLNMLKTHYRQPLDWTDEGVRESKAELDRFYLALRDASAARAAKTSDQAPEGVLEALRDDLNTPLAISRLHDNLRALNNSIKSGNAADIARLATGLTAAGAILGLLGQSPEAWLKGDNEDKGAIDALIARRIEAKKAKNFAEADRIRDELAGKGIVLEDKPGGRTEWRRAG